MATVWVALHAVQRFCPFPDGGIALHVATPRDLQSEGQVDEPNTLGNDITVTTHGVKGHQVRAGVDGPAEVAVHREEIYQRISRTHSRRRVRRRGVCGNRQT